MAAISSETPAASDQPYFWAKPTSEPKSDISGELRGKAIGQGLDAGASALHDGIQGITAAYEKGIQNTIYAQVDPLRDQYMERLHSADQAVQGRGTPDPLGRDAPRDVKGLPNTLGTLDSARANGKLSQTDYDARLNSLAKEVRAKYPGYREYVDEEFKRITGRDSANQYIRSVIGDIDSFIAKRKEGKDKIADKILGEGLNYPGANIWYQKMKQDPDKYGPAALEWLNENRAKDHALEMGEKTINAAKAMDSLDKEQRDRITNQGVTESGAHYYTAALDTITNHMDIDPKTNARMGDILARDRRGESLRDVKPEEAVQLRTFLEQQWASLSANRAADLQHHFPDMKTEDISKTIQDEFKTQYEPFMNALGKGDFSTANTVHNVMKARNDQSALQSYNDPKWGQTLSWLGGLKEIDPQLANMAGMQIGQQYGLEKTGEFAKAAAASAAPPNKGGGKQFGETAQELRIKNQTDGRLWKSLVELHASAAVKGPRAISDESATNLIQSAFGPKSGDLLSFFSGVSGNKGLGQQWVFDTLASNGMIDRTAKLSKEKPELYQNLRDWAGSNMKYLLNKDVTTPADPRYGGVRADYDTKTHSFSFKEPTVKGQLNDPYRTKALISLKSNMDRLVTITEKDPNRSDDPTRVVYNTLKSMNAPPGSLVSNMIRAIEAAHP